MGNIIMFLSFPMTLFGEVVWWPKMRSIHEHILFDRDYT